MLRTASLRRSFPIRKLSCRHTQSALSSQQCCRHSFSSFYSTLSSAAVQDLRNEILNNADMVDLLAKETVAWSGVNGLTMVKNPSDNSLMHAPLTILPSEIDQNVYDSVVNLSPIWGKLVDRVSKSDLLTETMSKVSDQDEFMACLISIHKTVQDEGSTQPLTLGIFRSDYMIDYDDEHNDTDNNPNSNSAKLTPLQVELNTISSSFGCLSTQVSGVHKFLLSRVHPHPEAVQALPDNQATYGIARALAEACKAGAGGRDDNFVLMVTQPGETNASDQRWIEYTLWNSFGVPVIRRSLAEIASEGLLKKDSQDLYIDNKRIGVTYFRAGYTPRDFSSLTMDAPEWQAVLKIERSSAVKCPSVAYHLTGAKKMQQLLAEEGVLVGNGLLSQKEADLITPCFAGLWALDNNEEQTLGLIDDAMSQPDRYVLKPQREGGGNNYWGDELKEHLSQLTVEERGAFILMQRIMPKPQFNGLMRNGQVELGQSLSELGIYSTYLGQGGEVAPLVDENVGHLIRTKFVGVNEGGVASQFAVLDSPILSV